MKKFIQTEKYQNYFFIAVRKAVWGKVIFSHLCVILFTRGFGFLARITYHITRGSASSGLHPGDVHPWI